MPRVVHVISTPSGVGGAERVVASLVRGAFERGWEPLVLNPFGRNGASSELAEICRPAQYEAYRCESPVGLPGLRRWLGRRVNESRPAILHAHLFHASVAAATVRLPAGTAMVLTHHHGDHLVYLGHRRRAALDRWAGSRYDRVVAISEATYGFLRSKYGYDESLLALIRNGWEGEPQPHVEDKVPTVVCVANFRRQKGHRELLESFARVEQHVPGVRLLLVGDGELRAEIEAQVAELGLRPQVEFRGRSVDVWAELAEADVFALASLYEPLGIAVIEAMAAGLPVVATRVGGIPELVSDERTGFLVEPGDAVGLERAISRLLLSSDRRRQMGDLGRSAAAKLTMGRMVGSYFELYESLAR